MDSSVILRHISMGTEMLLSHILLEASDEEIASEISVLYLQGYQSLCNSLPNMNGKFVYRLQCYQSLEISSYHFIISIFFSEKNIHSQFISRLLPHRKEHLNSYVIPFIDESYSGGCVCSQPKLGMYCTIFAGKRVKTSTLWRTQAFQPTNSIHMMKYLEFQAGLLLFPHFCPIPSVVLGLVQETLWHNFLCDCI